MATVVGVSIQAGNVSDGSASISGTLGNWYKKASGGIDNTYPEAVLIGGGTKTGLSLLSYFWRQMTNPMGTTNTFDAGKNGFAHGKKKQSTGKSGKDKHDKQYTHGGKNRPENPNKRHGADERRNRGKIVD